jgi:hypothetical protein
MAVGLFFGSGSAGLSHSFWGFDELGREKFGLTKIQPQGNPWDRRPQRRHSTSPRRSDVWSYEIQNLVGVCGFSMVSRPI